MRITYHEGKRAFTLADRGLDFADAVKVFAGRELTQADHRRDYGEERYQTIIISMRKCNDRERGRYGPYLG